MASGTDIAKAYVQIIPSAEGIKGKLTEIMGGEADSAGKSTGSKFGSAFGAALKTGGAVVAGFATATAAMTGAIIKSSNEVAEYGDHIDKMSQKMGLSAKAYQEWDAILQHSGTSIDSMRTGMRTLANAVENGNEAFERIGLSMDEIAGMSNEDLFAATISGLQNVENETERTYLAGQLLGRGATELGALLNTSAEDTEAMRQRVHELGGVMSDEAVKAAAAYQDSLQDMKTAFSGLGRNIMSEFMPSITAVMDGLTALFSGDEGGIALITDGINSFAAKITESLPGIMDAGAQILVSLTDAIVANLPALLSAGGEALMTIVNGLIENLPAIIETGLQVIATLAQGIADNLPTLVPTIVGVVTQIVETLVENADALVDASIAIVMALADGVVDAIPILIEKAPEIQQKLTDAIIRNAPKIQAASVQLIYNLAVGIANSLRTLLEKGRQMADTVISGVRGAFSSAVSAGRNIVEGIWNGISNGLGWIKNKISGWVGNVMAFLKNLFGIESPSKWARDEIGANLAAGIGVGFERGMGDVERMMRSTIPTVGDLLGNQQFSASLAPGGTAYNYGGVTIQITGRGKDADQLAVELQSALVRRAAAWA